jgi:hypothetical protein
MHAARAGFRGKRAATSENGAAAAGADFDRWASAVSPAKYAPPHASLRTRKAKPVNSATFDLCLHDPPAHPHDPRGLSVPFGTCLKSLRRISPLALPTPNCPVHSHENSSVFVHLFESFVVRRPQSVLAHTKAAKTSSIALLTGGMMSSFHWGQSHVQARLLHKANEKMRALNPGTGAPASAGLPGGSNTMVVGVCMMAPGEDAVVAKRLREVLQGAVSS